MFVYKVLVVLLLGFVSLSEKFVVQGCGMGTHNLIGHRAAYYFDFSSQPSPNPTSSLYPLFQTIINQHIGTFEAGLTFPDWGYDCKGFSNESEAAHWPPFTRGAVQYLRGKYGNDPTKWTDDGQKLAAFILGITSHQVADVSWHSLAGFSAGFIQVMAELDFFGWYVGDSYSEAHSVADFGGDTVFEKQFNHDFLTDVWDFPVSDIVNIYHSLGYPKVDYLSVLECTTELYIGTMALKYGGKDLYPYYALQSPFLIEQYNDFIFGGVDDMSYWTTYCWPAVMNWMVTGSTQTVPYCVLGGEHPSNTNSSKNANDTADSERTLPVHGSLSSVSLAASLIPQVVSKIKDSLRIDNQEYYVSLSLSEDNDLASDVEEKITPKTYTSENTKTVHQNYTLYTNVPYSYLGESLFSSDLNGDGFDDLIIGAPNYGFPQKGSAGIGKVYILVGNKDLMSNWPSKIDLDSMDGVLSVQSSEIHSRFGAVVSVLDFNSDGVKDLVVSAPSSGNYETVYYGAVYVYFGSLSGSDWTIDGDKPSVVINGIDNQGAFGLSLITGDVNNDDLDDIIIGVPQSNAQGIERGKVGIFYGGENRKTGDVLSLSDANWVLNGTSDAEWFGHFLKLVPLQKFTGGKNATLLLVGSPTFTNYTHFSATKEPLKNVGKVSAFYIQKEEMRLIFSVFGNSQFDRLGFSFTLGVPTKNAPSLALSQPTQNQNAGSVEIFSFDNLFENIQLDDLDDPSQGGKEFQLGDNILSTATISGNEFMEHFGLVTYFVELENNTEDSLFISAPWNDAAVVFMWKGGVDFPNNGVQEPVESANVVFTRNLQTENPSGEGRYGNQMAFPDLNGDDKLDIIVASKRDSSFVTLGGSVDIFISGENW